MSEYRRKKPNIRRPGVDRAQGFGGHYDPQPMSEPQASSVDVPPASDPEAAPEPSGKSGPTSTPAPSPAPAGAPGSRGGASQRRPAETPAPSEPEARKSQSGRRGAPGRAASATGPAASRTRGPAGGDRGPMKKVALTACPKEAQRAALEALTSELISIKDMVKLAGRRALARFEPTPAFRAVPVVPRMGSAHRYSTTKLVSEPVLDKLHGAVNPLGLKSDNEMLRGQFEPLFWSELDAIIEELQARQRQ